jgi:hypothetical protein
MTSDFLQLKFYLFYRKVEICWNFLFFYCKFEYLCYLYKYSPIFQNHKTEKKKKTLLMTVYVGLGKTFSPTRSFNFITSIKMQRKIQPNGMLCENSGVSMECNSLFISCAMHNNDHGSWTLYDVNSKKSMRQTVRRDGSPPISTTKYSYIIFLKKKPIRLHLLIHSICCWALPPQGTGTPSIGLFSSICPWSCFPLLCLMIMFQIDLKCIKTFSIILVFT